jgi:hypothetical protein
MQRIKINPIIFDDYHLSIEHTTCGQRSAQWFQPKAVAFPALDRCRFLCSFKVVNRTHTADHCRYQDADQGYLAFASEMPRVVPGVGPNAENAECRSTKARQKVQKKAEGGRRKERCYSFMHFQQILALPLTDSKHHEARRG